MDTACRICGNRVGNTEHCVQERMIGTLEEFIYSECGACGSLQIVPIPADLNRYYPANYYSFRLDGATGGSFRRQVRAWRDEFTLTGAPVFAAPLAAMFPQPALHSLRPLMKASRDTRVLDVGSGSGGLVAALRRVGFRRVLGIDPYLPEMVGNDQLVQAIAIEQMTGLWDLIMFHHSLEHVPDPLSSLVAARRLLAPSGSVLIRVPTSSSQAWRTYGSNWVQLDAPRHLHIFSISGLERLANSAGLKVRTVRYDSTAFQFWGSEQYARGITLLSPRSYSVSPETSIFSRRQILAFERQARQLNAANLGDQIAAYLETA